MNDQTVPRGSHRYSAPIRLTVGRKIGGVVATVLVLLAIVAVYAVLQIRLFGDDLDDATRDVQITQIAGSVDALSQLRLAAVSDFSRLTEQNRPQEREQKATEIGSLSDDIATDLADLRTLISAGASGAIAVQTRYVQLLPLVEQLEQLNTQIAEAAAVFIAAIDENRIEAARVIGDLERLTGEMREAPIAQEVGLLAESSRAAVDARQSDAFILILVVGAVALLLGSVVSAVIVKRLTNSVAQIAERAEIIGDTVATDEFRHEPVEVDTDDEIQDLALIFNQMSERLYRNIEERREIEQQLADARDEAVLANETKSNFMANMSHELRTPLNAIIGYSEMLQDEMGDINRQEFVPDLQRINDSGYLLLRLINDILDISKIEAGRMDLYFETFDIKSHVESAISVVRPTIDRNSNELQVKCADDLGEMHADSTKVRQALFNLLSNAAKFTQDGKVTLTVWADSSDDRDWINYAVADTGIGIREEHMGRLFQEFSQADASTAAEFGGTGLGLSLSRSFITMMGGDITVESEFGVGSTFTIRMPRVVEDTGTVEPAQDPTDISSTKAVSSRTQVLVVDDDENVRDILNRYLTREGYSVSLASGGWEALKMAKSLHPDVITLDVLMPDLDGWTVLSTLKSDPELMDIPVIILTMVEDRSTGFKLGAAEYLSKPIERERISAVLSKYKNGGGSVLLLEDDTDTRTLMRRVLERDGWSVVEAQNGREGIRKLEDGTPSIIVLDLLMPEMDGFQFLSAIQDREDVGKVPVIVVTAKDLTDDDRSRLTDQVQKVLEKGSYTRDQLLDEVKELISGSLDQSQATGSA